MKRMAEANLDALMIELRPLFAELVKDLAKCRETVDQYDVGRGELQEATDMHMSQEGVATYPELSETAKSQLNEMWKKFDEKHQVVKNEAVAKAVETSHKIDEAIKRVDPTYNPIHKTFMYQYQTLGGRYDIYWDYVKRDLLDLPYKEKGKIVRNMISASPKVGVADIQPGDFIVHEFSMYEVLKNTGARHDLRVVNKTTGENTTLPGLRKDYAERSYQVLPKEQAEQIIEWNEEIKQTRERGIDLGVKIAMKKISHEAEALLRGLLNKSHQVGLPTGVRTPAECAEDAVEAVVKHALAKSGYKSFDVKCEADDFVESVWSDADFVQADESFYNVTWTAEVTVLVDGEKVFVVQVDCEGNSTSSPDDNTEDDPDFETDVDITSIFMSEVAMTSEAGKKTALHGYWILNKQDKSPIFGPNNEQTIYSDNAMRAVQQAVLRWNLVGTEHNYEAVAAREAGKEQVKDFINGGSATVGEEITYKGRHAIVVDGRVPLPTSPVIVTIQYDDGTTEEITREDFQRDKYGARKFIPGERVMVVSNPYTDEKFIGATGSVFKYADDQPDKVMVRLVHTSGHIIIAKFSESDIKSIDTEEHLTRLRGAKTANKNLICLFIDGDYLAGANDADEENAANPEFWPMELRESRFTIAEISNVPDDIAEKLLVQGTSDQEYSDGYEAAQAVADLPTVWEEEYRGRDEEGDDDNEPVTLDDIVPFPIADTVTIGTSVMDWHGGQNTAIYSLGSTLVADKMPTAKQVYEALDELVNQENGLDKTPESQASLSRVIDVLELVWNEFAAAHNFGDMDELDAYVKNLLRDKKVTWAKKPGPRVYSYNVVIDQPGVFGADVECGEEVAYQVRSSNGVIPEVVARIMKGSHDVYGLAHYLRSTQRIGTADLLVHTDGNKTTSAAPQHFDVDDEITSVFAKKSYKILALTLEGAHCVEIGERQRNVFIANNELVYFKK